MRIVNKKGERGKSESGQMGESVRTFAPLPPFTFSPFSCRRLTLPDPFAIKTVRFSGRDIRYREEIFRSSSMAEHSAVNRRVVGSSPTCGAVIPKIKLKKRPLAKVALIFVRSTLRSWLL